MRILLSQQKRLRKHLLVKKSRVRAWCYRTWRIGQLVANAAISLGMEVYGYDPYLSVNAAWNLSSEVKHIVNVEDIYKECDYITIHVPALDSN